MGCSAGLVLRRTELALSSYGPSVSERHYCREGIAVQLPGLIDSSCQDSIQYMLMRSEVDTQSYTVAAYLQAVGGWRQRKQLAQLRTGSLWLALETRRFGPTLVNRPNEAALPALR